MSTETKKISSNATELRIAQEATVGVLPADPDWFSLQPNSYNDFGGNLSLVARNPINAGRNREKGVITDLDASGGFNQDLTFSNLSFLWPGLFLSTRFERGLQVGITTVDATAGEYEATGIETGVVAGNILLATGFVDAVNNGLKTVTGTAAGAVAVAEALVEDLAPPAASRVEVVGIQGDVGEFDVVAATGSQGPRLVRVGGTIDFTTFGLIPGEPVFVGGDDAANRFVAEENNGWFVLREIGVDYLQFHKSDGGADGETEPSAEVGAGLAIQIFTGKRNRNLSTLDTGFNCATYTIERALGKANPVTFPTAIQSEVLTGSLLNEFALNIGQADKITVDATFISLDNVQRDGLTEVQRGEGEDEQRLSDSVGELVPITQSTAYNTSSDFSRIRLAVLGESDDTAPEPLFAFLTELQLNVSNNGTVDKAIGKLGGFDVTPGTFEVSGQIEAFFSDINSVKAVRNNADVTLDAVLVKDFVQNGFRRKSGIFIDVPLIALGDGRLSVEQDQAVRLPLVTDAAVYEPFGHTLLISEFSFLPDVADEDIC